MAEQQHGMREDIALGMEVRGLRGALHGDDLRQNNFQQPAFVQQLEAAPGAAFGQDAGNLLADPFPGNHRDTRRQTLHRGKCRRVDIEFQTGGKPHRADHAQAVFLEARLGIADGAYQAAPKILSAADQIDHSIGERIVNHAVDREVAPVNVLCQASRSAPHSAGGHRDTGRHGGNSPLQTARRRASTRITPNCAPTGIVSGKMRWMSSGRALVAMS